MSSYEFGVGDYGKSVTFRIYNEDEAVFDASTYTGVEIIVTNHDGSEVFRLTPSWTTQNQGVGTFAMTSEKYLDVQDYYFVEAQLTKTGEKTSTEAVKIVALRSST